MFGRGGLECRDDPLDALRVEPKYHVLSFVAVERLIGGDFDPPGNRSEFSVLAQVQNKRSEEITGNIEGSEGMSTLLH